MNICWIPNDIRLCWNIAASGYWLKQLRAVACIAYIPWLHQFIQTASAYHLHVKRSFSEIRVCFDLYASTEHNKDKNFDQDRSKQLNFLTEQSWFYSNFVRPLIMSHSIGDLLTKYSYSYDVVGKNYLNTPSYF